MKPHLLFFYLSSFLTLSSVAAPDLTTLMGAKELLKLIAEGGGDSVLSQEPEGGSRETFRRDFDRYAVQRNGMVPAEAAEAWLALFDRFWDLPRTDGAAAMYYDSGMERRSPDAPVTVQHLVEALPPPSAWPELRKRVEARGVPDRVHAIALRVMLCFLDGDVEGAEAALGAIEDLKLKSYQRETLRYQVQELRKQLQVKSIQSTQDLLKHYRVMLELRQKETSGGRSGRERIEIPNLLSMTDETDARRLILDTLRLPGCQVSVPSGGRTLALVKAVVLEHIDELAAPQWRLITSTADVGLFEAMEKRYPAPAGVAEAVVDGIVDVFSTGGMSGSAGEFQYERRDATAWYIMGLIEGDQTDRAVSFVLAHPSDQIPDYRYGGRQAALRGESALAVRMCEFCREVLRKAPERPYWDDYVAFARSTAGTQALLGLADEILSRPGLGVETTVNVLTAKVSANLGADRIEEAGGALRQLAALLDRGGVSAADRRETARHLTDCAQRMIRVARLTSDDPLLADGLALGTRLTAMLSGQDEYAYRTILPFDVLLDAGLVAPLERNVLERIKRRCVKSGGARGGWSGQGYAGVQDLSGELTDLVQIYDRAGRHQDVLLLMEQADAWRAPDLLGLMHTECVLPVAKALVETGQAAVAECILKYFLMQRRDNDTAYALLTQIKGAALIPWLDELYERDRFEERPLIWKAHLQRLAGELDLAEQTIRAALKIDPTDGEQPAGDRVRAYSVLADILQDRGKVDDAKFFRDVVKSVRLAEEGDALADAGLTARSIERYEKAEALFVDAYCVQWRLAERLYEMGRFEEARKHYEIAFERMPEQFGRVASFCFGCAGVFEREHSRSIAEEVMLRLEKTTPDRPQVHFLIGQLREAQGRYEDAYASFRHAVDLDPEYLDAWNRLADLKEALFVPQKEQDAMALRMLELDPLQKHFSGNLRDVAQLALFWPILQQNARFKTEPPESLFPLTASAAARAKRAAGASDPFAAMQMERMAGYQYDMVDRVLTVESFLAQHTIISQCIRLMTAVQYDMF